MGLCNSPNILKMNELFNGLKYIIAYIDDLFIISNGNFEDHVKKAKKLLKQSKTAAFKINLERSFFAKKLNKL